ncbi:hypothetical protein RRG08_027902 [Elysia crispata]|uniref:Uncharacterized protein n=1 Tax=Elysia crispata TaxID=231223 RepID=A0AAE1DTH5_9GAST|nr:hypothetical protein RRG08_027902 [Elysia crispata]
MTSTTRQPSNFSIILYMIQNIIFHLSSIFYRVQCIWVVVSSSTSPGISHSVSAPSGTTSVFSAVCARVAQLFYLLRATSTFYRRDECITEGRFPKHSVLTKAWKSRSRDSVMGKM